MREYAKEAAEAIRDTLDDVLEIDGSLVKNSEVDENGQILLTMDDGNELLLNLVVKSR